MKKNTLGGVVAAFGISITAAIALPLVNVFTSLTPGELMIVRGGVSAVLILCFFARRLSLPVKKVLTFSFLFGLANFGLYSGIREWGANPTIVLITATPAVNIVAKWLRGERVALRVILALAALLLGVVIALNPWETVFSWPGLLWSAGATVAIGIGFEALGDSSDIDPYHKSFWIAALMVSVGVATTLIGGKIPMAGQVWTWLSALKLLGYGLTGGFLYILANVIAFEKLKTEVASTLAMGETPAVILGAWLILGETMSLTQWVGVAIAMVAVFALSAAEVNKAEDDQAQT